MRCIFTLAVLFSAAALIWAQNSPGAWFDKFSRNEKICRTLNNISQTANLTELTRDSAQKIKCYVKCQYNRNMDNVGISNCDRFVRKTMQVFAEMNPKAIRSTIEQHRSLVAKCCLKNSPDTCDAYAEFSLCTSEEYRAKASSSTPSGTKGDDQKN